MEMGAVADVGMRELLRAVNEEIAAIERRSTPHARDAVAFVCECGSSECHEPVFLSLADFERLRELEGWHLLRGGHQAPGDVVLRYHDAAVVVCRSRQASAFV